MADMEDFFFNVLNKHALIKTIRVRGNNLPYVTAEVKSLMRQEDYLRGKANKTGSKYLTAYPHVLQNLTESSLVYDLNGIPFDLISDTSDNANGLWLTWKTFF